jgi:transcription initiation factor TFIIE subunit alpha
MIFEDLLHDAVVQKYLHELVGERGMPVAASPPEGEVTDEELAQKLGLELNNIRRALFILYENELVSYRRVRDEDSGWLTYLWTFNYDQIRVNLVEAMVELHTTLAERYEYELENEFYLCPSCSIRFSFTDAIEKTFICPTCDSKLDIMDNSKLLISMDSRLNELSGQISLVSATTSII